MKKVLFTRAHLLALCFILLLVFATAFAFSYSDNEAFADGVSDPADAAFEDYSEVRSVFKDAGVSKEMAALIQDPQVKLSWDMLSSAAMNIGNIDDRVYEQAEG